MKTIRLVIGWLVPLFGLLGLVIILPVDFQRPRRTMPHADAGANAHIEELLREWERDPEHRPQIIPHAATLELTLDAADLNDLQDINIVMRFKRERRDCVVRFDGGDGQVASFSVRGESSMERAYASSPVRHNYTVRLAYPVELAAGARVRNVYLMNLAFDPLAYEMAVSQTLLADVGLFPAAFQFVRLQVNGEDYGWYMLIERPQDAIRRVHPSTSFVYRRMIDGTFEPVFETPQASMHEHVSRLRRLVAQPSSPANNEALVDLMDIDGYLAWIGFNSLVLNADSIDELYTFVAHLEDGGGERAMLKFMGWDYDDILSEAPAHPEDVIADPLMYACEDDLDRLIQASPRLYSRFRNVLRELLLNEWNPDRIREAADHVRTMLPIDSDENSQAFGARRRDALSNFVEQTKLRRQYLLDVLSITE